MSNLNQQENHTNTGIQQEPLFLNTKEVMVRYRLYCYIIEVAQNSWFPKPNP
ncbi:hypothetical protein [Shewanella frigidimarina]|uniref:hypothetical protein n=1 Tax=Shewanella frigidimarina TaxID=56812 RepID=UPI003D7AA091